MKLPLQYREFDVADRAIDKENRTISFSVSSETPVEKFWGTEILSHERGAIDTDRLDRGAVPFLTDHDRAGAIGRIISYEIKNRRLYATAKISQRAEAQDVFQDIADDIRNNISVGYRALNVTLKERDEKGHETYLVTKWAVYEISTVSIPADATVGVGRSEQAQEFDVQIENAEVTETRSVFTGKPSIATMPDANSTNPQTQTISSSQPAPANQAQLDNVRDAERARVRELLALGERHGFQKKAEDFIYSGQAPADLRAAILDDQIKFAEKTAIGSNPLGMNTREIKRYSICKAIRQGKLELDGLEREASDGLTKVLHREPAGFFVPDVALMPLNARDLSSGIASAGGVTIELQVEPTLIEYLRNKMILGRAGAVMLGGLVGNISIPRQTGPGQAYWLAENAPTTASSLVLDQIGLSPKRLAAMSNYSRQLVAQSSLDIENMVRDDLLTVIALAQDAAGLYGTGVASNQPAGLLGYPANPAGTYNYAQRAASVTFGGAATWKSVVQFEANVEDCNVDLDETAAYVTTPLVKGVWKTATKAVNYPVYLWEGGGDPGAVNGYKAFATKQVQSNTVVFGKWRDAIVATWSGLDMITDPFSLAPNFQIRVVVNLLTDINFRYVLSFCASTDAGNQ